MDTDSIHAKMHSVEEIKNLLRFYSQKLPIKESYAFLMGLCGCESSFGADDIPRYEPAYGPGGLYFQRSKDLQSVYSNWGALVSCSYGPLQILYINAKQLGYLGHPLDLSAGTISIPYGVQLLNQNYNSGAKTPEDLYATYNGGMGALKKTNNYPQNYVTKAMIIYNKFIGQ